MSIHAWVASAAMMPSGQVIWTGQNSPRPAGAYITMRLESAQHGRDWVEIHDVDDPDPGGEIEYRSSGVRDVLLTLQAFPDLRAIPVEIRRPERILQDLVTRSRLPTPELAMAKAAGLLGFGPVRSIDGVIGSSLFEPRAILDVRLSVADTASEFVTYIESVELPHGTVEIT